MTPFVDDPDFQLHVGDALDVLRQLPAESVHCCVTSPPYWGLRDYGTGTWDGGDADCDHSAAVLTRHGGWDGNNKNPDGTPRESRYAGTAGKVADTCKCGATRVDQQLGLEPTPDEYVTNMVAVFREVRRVLRADGTLWLNIGDTYNAGTNATRKAPVTSVDVGGWQTAEIDGGARIAFPGLKTKDLCGLPWRLAFALQADGWYLRSDIIWSKPNPMPESVTDRPTKAHEYLFLLTKSPRYYFDSDAIREPHSPDGRAVTQVVGGNGSLQHRDGERWPGSGRNKRSVWEIATEPYPDAHFATFPQALVEPCVKAGCPEWVCGTCGKARERIVEKELIVHHEQRRKHDPTGMNAGSAIPTTVGSYDVRTLGWSDCGHNNYQPGTVLDPFLGSGTTALVARRLGRKCVGIELNPDYAQLCAKRLQQLSLFASEHAEA